MRHTNKIQHQQKCREISNHVCKLTRQDHAHHLDYITSNLHNNQRQFWRWLKNTRCDLPQIPEIHYQNSVLSTPFDKATAFNDHFSSIFVNENMAPIEALKMELSKSWSEVHTSDVEISRDDVLQLLLSIDVHKASGPDGIPGRLLKEGAHWIATPIQKLFNLSPNQGSLPREWVTANVSPVFKKGNKHLPINYRPISLTCIVVKILERIVYNTLVEFLSSNDKLSPCQHGFRRGLPNS